MEIFSKQILTDERDQPVAVQIEYREWLRREKAQETIEPRDDSKALMAFAGTIKWDEDGLEYQNRLRAE